MPSPSQRWGAAREALAEETLARGGYAIVARNWRGGGGEVDRIAWDGEILCFVEVRARSSRACGLPAETVDRKKQGKLVRAAMAFVVAENLRPWPMIRFDVVSIVDSGEGEPEVWLIKNAFDAGR